MAKARMSKARTGKQPPRRPQRGAGSACTSPLDTFWDTESFLALSDAEKEKVWRSLHREIPPKETRPP
jgi:hypothetical protein